MAEPILYFDIAVLLIDGGSCLVSCERREKSGFIGLSNECWSTSRESPNCLGKYWILKPKSQKRTKEFVKSGDELYLVHAITGMYMKNAREHLFENVVTLRRNDGDVSDASFLWEITSKHCTGILMNRCKITLRNRLDYLVAEMHPVEFHHENVSMVLTRKYHHPDADLIISKVDRSGHIFLINEIIELKKAQSGLLDSVKRENLELAIKLETETAKKDGHYKKLTDTKMELADNLNAHSLEVKHLYNEIDQRQEIIESMKLVSDATLFEHTFMTSNNLSPAIHAIDANQQLILKPNLITKESSSSTNYDAKNASFVGPEQFAVSKTSFFAMALSLGLLVIILIIIGVIWCVQRWKKSKKVISRKLDVQDDVTVDVVRHTVDIKPVLKEMDKPKMKAIDTWKSIKMTQKEESDEDLFVSLSVDEGTGTGTGHGTLQMR